MKATFKLPHVFGVDERSPLYTVQQIARAGWTVDGSVANYSSPEVKGKIISGMGDSGSEVLLIDKLTPLPTALRQVLITKWKEPQAKEAIIDLSAAKWVRHPILEERRQGIEDYGARLKEVILSWRNGFSYLEENVEKNLKGLRPPQLGAVHAVHAHWSISNEAATIVMPTGTGKTETMLCVLISTPCPKVLVVVPTDALRGQIANKFLTLGILKDEDCRVLGDEVRYPIVGILKQIPKTARELDELVKMCNVVVTTSQLAGRCSVDVQEELARRYPYLFIDEAHHVAAPTWSTFKERFARSRILQFTATPFREDDKPIEGKIIFKYPLKKAQEEGYFKRIRFRPVYEFDPKKADVAIAEEAVKQLREDAQYKHILMARVETVERAKQVFAIYKKYAEFDPVEIHTGIKSAARREQIRQKIISGQSRIVVCVNMLGEGFDLPELKIAAFHDIRKGLAITLQLVGRFTRSRPDLGEATIIANLANVNVVEERRKLYAQDTDWNSLLPQLAEEVIEQQIRLAEFVKGFADFPDDIPLRNVRPAASTVVYKTKCVNWSPENFAVGIPGMKSLERVHYGINWQENVLVVITARKVAIDWVGVRDIFNWDWELFVVYWDDSQGLLFINNSANNGYFKALAEAVAGDVEMIDEQLVFRCFYGVNRLRLQNVGLSEHLGRLTRYTGRMGSNVEAGLTSLQKRNARKSVLFGSGFEDGRKTTIGASRKGRIWSFATTNLSGLTEWCRSVGTKLLNEDIDPDEVLRGTLESEIVTDRPGVMPIGIDWPEDMYKSPETAYTFSFGETGEALLLNTEIRLKDPATEGDLKFEISSDIGSVGVTLSIVEKDGLKDCRYSTEGRQKVVVKWKGKSMLLEDYLYENDPVIWFVDGSSLEGNNLTRLKAKYPPYEREKIDAWEWSGVNLKKESQELTKEPDSIQFRVIETLKRADYSVIFDDDGSGEAADVVGIKVNEREDGVKVIDVEFYHCKFSQEEKPGARIKDLYEVCGQAQKSIHWMESNEKQVELFTHLLSREPKRQKGKESSRFEKGGRDGLISIREMSRMYAVELKIFIVQPGLSRGKASKEQLELLSVTENHLMETYRLPFRVIASA